MVRLALPEEKEQIKVLWQTCFHDEDSYIDFFFSRLPEPECLFYLSGNKPASMLLLLNCTLGSFTGKYIFAACTHPAYRGRGYMKTLLSGAEQLCRDKADFLCLVPANHTLFDYYRKCGYQTFFYFERVCLTVPKGAYSESAANNSLSFSDFCKIRSAMPNFVQWGSRETNLVFEENLFNGGKNIRTPSGYAILREENEICHVIEWVSDTYHTDELLHLTRCKHIDVKKPVLQGNSNAVPSGMLYQLHPDNKEAFYNIKKPCLSLVLD